MKHDGKVPGLKCEEEHIVEGEWCEDGCANPTSQVGHAGGMSAGTCKDAGFPVYIARVNIAIFAKEDNAKLQSDGDYHQKPDCKAHYKVTNGDMCETFCITPALVEWSEKRE